MKPLKTGATYDDLCDVPDLFIAEIADGDLYASRRPPVRHVYAASVLGAEIGAQFDRSSSGPDGWIMLNKPELHFGSDVLPEVAPQRLRTITFPLNVLNRMSGPPLPTTTTVSRSSRTS